jgi:hypothetical protein
VAQIDPLKLAQIELKDLIQNQKVAQIKPKRLALTDRNQWHKSNRNSQKFNNLKKDCLFF